MPVGYSRNLFSWQCPGKGWNLGVGRSISEGDSDDKNRFERLRSSGGYRNLRSFQVVTIIYDATVSFCERFMDTKSRTVDQMVQAARSGRQNIAEGSRAAATSSQTELRLVNVARASLDELLLDYEDYLRQRGHRQWRKDDQEALKVREVGRERSKDRSDQPDPTDPTHRFVPYTSWIMSNDPAVVANTILCLIHQANYLLDKQITGLERQFIQEGGYSEQLAAARIAERQKQKDRSDQTDRARAKSPNCPQCGKPMVLRTVRNGNRAGKQFWGCSEYPVCKGTANI